MNTVRSMVAGMLTLSLSSPARAADSTAGPGPTLRALYQLPSVERFEAKRTALVLVDFQEEFFHGRLVLAGAPAAAAAARELLAWARKSGVMVVHVRNVTRPGSALFAPNSPTVEFAPQVAPLEGETVVVKPTGGAFTKTELDRILKARGIDTIVTGGLMTHLAVAMTAQDGALLGYRVVVAAEATATRDLPAGISAEMRASSRVERPDRRTFARDTGDAADREARPRRTPSLDGAGLPAEVMQAASLAAIADRFAQVLPVEVVMAMPIE